MITIKIALVVVYVITIIFFAFVYNGLGSTHFNNYNLKDDSDEDSDNDTENNDSNITDGLYLSMTTMSTVGFGDITPKTKTAKFVVMFQQFLTIFFGLIFVLDLGELDLFK